MKKKNGVLFVVWDTIPFWDFQGFDNMNFYVNLQK